MNTQENNKTIAQIIKTQQNNKMIAEFMEHSHPFLPSKSTINYIAEDLEYDNDWNWLMPVVGKIEEYLSANVGKVGYFDECLSSNDLDIRYNAVVEFINQLNK